MRLWTIAVETAPGDAAVVAGDADDDAKAQREDWGAWGSTTGVPDPLVGEVPPGDVSPVVGWPLHAATQPRTPQSGAQRPECMSLNLKCHAWLGNARAHSSKAS